MFISMVFLELSLEKKTIYSFYCANLYRIILILIKTIGINILYFNVVTNYYKYN